MATRGNKASMDILWRGAVAIVLADLLETNGISLIVSTYQAVSGAGAKAMRELEEQSKVYLSGGKPEPEVLPWQIAFNLFCHNTKVNEQGYNAEEIADQYPQLNMAQVYAALFHYHSHREEVEVDLEAEKKEAERLELESQGSLTSDANTPLHR